MNGATKHRALLTVVFAGLLGFLWPLYEFLGKLQSWEVLWNPPSVAQLVFCVISALVAIGAALGLDLSLVKRGDVATAPGESQHERV